jgi:uncharacterized protein (DUF924 family)
LNFKGGKEVDNLIRDKFETILIDASNGKYDQWRKEARGSVALLVLFDQFSRNIYRNTPKMFSFDHKGLEIAYELINNESNFNKLSSVEKCFVYLVLIHSENQKDLETGCNGQKNILDNSKSESTKTMANGFYTQGLEHLDVIQQFGRYPHRNDILGRTTTPDEAKFLETSTYAFVVSMRKKCDGCC